MKSIKNVSVFFITIILAACSTISSNNETTRQTTSSTAPAAENAAATAGLVGVNVNPKTGEEENVVVNMAGGAPITTASMNESDKSSMSHALDAPLGKSVQWTNTVTGFSYTVTPIKKIVIQENPFCREYGLVTVKDGDREAIRGTACVMKDGNWHKVT